MKLLIPVLFFFALLIFIVFNTLQPKTVIISWFVTDDKLLVVTKNGGVNKAVLENGDRYGDSLKIYSYFEIVDDFPRIITEPKHVFDLADIKPLKVQAGDINGDGKAEIALCVYKTAEFHPVLAKRPFFYNLEGGELVPIWLGSRLARPFEDYVLFDIDNDGIFEILSIELTENGNRLLAVYDWKGFGFEVKGISGELTGEVSFGDVNFQLERPILYLDEEVYIVSTEDGVVYFSKSLSNEGSFDYE